MTLAQFPNGCHGCGGACCKLVHGFAPPYGDWELDENPSRGDGRRFNKLPDRCPELLDDGLCGVQHDKPKLCRDFVVASADCNAFRGTMGIK